jgi:hypothetical protein
MKGPLEVEGKLLLGHRAITIDLVCVFEAAGDKSIVSQPSGAPQAAAGYRGSARRFETG